MPVAAGKVSAVIYLPEEGPVNFKPLLSISWVPLTYVVVRPTVAVALTVSYIISMREKSLVAASRTVDIKVRGLRLIERSRFLRYGSVWAHGSPPVQ